MERQMASVETKNRLRTIRRISGPFPDRTAEERLKTIIGVADGTLDPMEGRNKTSPNLLERLAAGQASRSPRNAADKRPKAEPKPVEADEEKERKGRRGRDRQERGGIDRSADLNG
jgi:hypothetical protein